MDMSGSIGRQNFELMINFVRDVINGLQIGTTGRSRVGVVTFANNAQLFLHLNTYNNKYDILNAFPPYYSGGTTNTADAIRWLWWRHDAEILSGLLVLWAGNPYEDLNKMATNLWMTILNAFPWKDFFCFDLKSLKCVPKYPTETCRHSFNYLMRNRRQAITWISDAPVHKCKYTYASPTCVNEKQQLVPTPYSPFFAVCCLFY